MNKKTVSHLPIIMLVPKVDLYSKRAKDFKVSWENEPYHTTGIRRKPPLVPISKMLKNR